MIFFEIFKVFFEFYLMFLLKFFETVEIMKVENWNFYMKIPKYIFFQKLTQNWVLLI